jgi:hypothetical protein
MTCINFGIRVAERLGVQALVCTHVNKDHIHKHIPINAYLPDGNGKFLDNKENRMKIRELSDQIQREYGLEIGLAPPKRQRVMSKEKTGSLNYGEWSAKGSGNSWKDQMRLDIREAAGQCGDRSELIQAMGSLGYHVERETANSITWAVPMAKKSVIPPLDQNMPPVSCLIR